MDKFSFSKGQFKKINSGFRVGLDNITQDLLLALRNNYTVGLSCIISKI